MKLIYDKNNKTKTFLCQFDIDYFLGEKDFEHKPVNETTYAKLCNEHRMNGMTWDDGAIMTANEWVKCVQTIYSIYNE